MDKDQEMRLSQPVKENRDTKKLISSASLVCMIAFVGIVDRTFAAPDADAEKAQTSASQQVVSASGANGNVMLLPRSQLMQERKKKLNMKELRRLDFRVSGSSCAACLRRIHKRVDKAPGVLDVAVAIKKPYGVAVIYDSTKTSQQKLMDAAKKDEKLDVQFHEPVDVKISEPPQILIPIYNELLKK